MKLTVFSLFLLIPFWVYGQKGEVIAPNGAAVISAVVTLNKIDSTFIKSVITDSEGRFDLKSEIKPYMLVFSHVSYATRKIVSEADDLGKITLQDKLQVLGEVVIKPEQMRQLRAYKSYHLSNKDIAKYADFLHALNEIPFLSVDMNNKLSYMGMGSVKVLLNGVNSDENELATLNSEDIAKIEVYDMPPARFAAMGITSVVNIVTKRNITGGAIGINLKDAVHPLFGNNSVGASYNHGDSRWSFNYDNTLRRNKKNKLFQKLAYEFDGKEYNKTKKGLDSPFNWDVNAFQVAYMNRKKDKYQINITSGLEIQKRMEKYAQDVMYFGGEAFLAHTLDKNKYNKYTLDVYYDKIFNEKNDFLVNVTGTYYHSNLFSNYAESDPHDGSIYFNSYSKISSKKPSLIADMRFTHSTKAGVLSFGLRDHIQHNAQEVKTGDVEKSGISSFSNQLYAYSEFNGQVGDILYYNASLGVEHSYFKREEANLFSSVYFNPRFRLTYMIKKNIQLFTIYELRTTLPSLSMTSETPIWIDNKYAYQGNSTIKPYRTHYFLLGSYCNFSSFNFAVNLTYESSPNAFLPYFKEGNEAVLQTYENMNRSETYDAAAVISWYPFQSKNAILKLTGYLTQYKVNGTEYNWIQNSARLTPEVQLSFHKFSANLFYQTSSQLISGQLLRKLPAAAYGEFYYTPRKGMKIGMGWRYPFFDAYKEGTEVHPSALVQSVSTTATKDYANMIYVCFNYNFSFGRNKQKFQKKVHNKDVDTGILTR